ncbi:THAP-type domain-containing protein, partial [Aphis craccivora]
LLTAVEKSFVKHCKDNDVFLLTLDDFFNNNKFINFPCIQHKTDILTTIISNFMRMKQYSLITNKNTSKVNAKKKN